MSTKAIHFVKQYWVWCFILASIVLLAQGLLYLSVKANGQYSAQESLYTIDATGAQDLSDIYSLPNEQWKAVERPFFESVEGKVWLRLALPYRATQPHANEQLLFRLKDPLIDRVQILLVRHEENSFQVLEQFEMGDTHSFASRSLLLPHFVLPINENAEGLFLYINASSKLSINLEYGLWGASDFVEFNNHLTIFFGLIFGYILALVCYSLMMSLTARRAGFMWYGLYLGAFLVHAMTLSGFGFQYIWPNWVGFQSVIGGVSISLTYLCLVKFSGNLAGKDNSIFQNATKWFMYVFIALSLWSLLSLNSATVKWHLLAIVACSVAMPLLCFFTCRKQPKVGIFLTLIWAVFMMTALMSLSTRLGVFHLPLEPLYTLYLGFHLETLLIGAALIYGYRINYFQAIKLKETAMRDQEKAIKAKDEIVKIQQDAQLELEKQVKAQTQQLEEALQNLSLASKELTQKRNVDGLTGLPNRLAFDESLKAMAKRSIKNDTSLCVAVIDIDHFKAVNDTHGHLAGDECLVKFASLFSEHFSSREYSLCRFGGEEFILATSLPKAELSLKIERFRQALEDVEVQSGGASIRFTISAGIAQKQIKSPEDSEKLIALADENLYLAKQKGRNLVVA